MLAPFDHVLSDHEELASDKFVRLNKKLGLDC